MSHHYSLVPPQSHAIPSHLIPQSSPHPYSHLHSHSHPYQHLQPHPHPHPHPQPHSHSQHSVPAHPHSPPLVASVSHLSSATSLYASLLLPLSIQLLHTNQHTQPPISSFGLVHCYPPQQILNLTQAPQYFPIQLAHIFLPAPNPQALRDFWAQCELLIPGTVGHIEQIESGERCCLRDYDGNLIEVHWSMQPAVGISGPEVMNMENSIPYHGSRERNLKHYPLRQRESTRHREKGRVERDRVDRDRKERDRGEREKGGRESDDRNRGDRDRGDRDRDRRDWERDGRNRDRGRKETFPLGSSSFPSAMPPDKDTRRVLQWQKDVARSISLPDEDSLSDDSDEYVDRNELPPICDTGNNYPDTPCRERRGRGRPSAPKLRTQRAGSYPKDINREKEPRRVYDRPKVGRRETVADMERSREYTKRDSRSKHPSRIQGKQVLGSLIGGAATAAVVYGMINSRPDSPPPVSTPRYRHSYAHKSQSDPFAYRSSDRRNRSVGHSYATADHKGIQMIDREVWAARRDSGIGGMSGISSSGDRVDGRSSSSGTRHDSYKTGPEGSRSSEGHRYHFGDNSSRRQRARNGEPRNRYSRPLTILPAAPEPGSESSEGSESESSGDSDSDCESESEREIERERVRNRQKRTARIEKEQWCGKEQDSDLEDRERPAHDRPTPHAEGQGSKQDSSYASAKPYHSPTISVISQSLSSTSGSTLKAERELISKVPTPPSAISPRFRGSSHLQRERDWRRHTENETNDYYSGPHRGYGSEYNEYSAAPAVTVPSYPSHHHEPRHRHWDDQQHGNRRGTRAAREFPSTSGRAGYEYQESVSPGDSVSSANTDRHRRRRTQKHGRQK